MSRLLTISAVVLLLAASPCGWPDPSAIAAARAATRARAETAIARRLHLLSMPRAVRGQKNPVAISPEVLQKSLRHFADHCASCHANNGSGDTEIGSRVYPRSPDMRQPGTQQLTDGELYYIIHNGIRWTGMPAWGASDYDPETWQLVHFIRHLPNLTSPRFRRWNTTTRRAPPNAKNRNKNRNSLTETS